MQAEIVSHLTAAVCGVAIYKTVTRFRKDVVAALIKERESEFAMLAQEPTRPNYDRVMAFLDKEREFELKMQRPYYYAIKTKLFGKDPFKGDKGKVWNGRYRADWNKRFSEQDLANFIHSVNDCRE